MSTANFAIKNARKYYVTERDRETILDGAILPGWYETDDWERGYLSRSYPGKYILEKRFRVELTGRWSYDFTAKIVYRYGYYDGAVLDWTICGDNYAGSLEEYEDSGEFSEQVARYAILDCQYYDGWNNGFCAIMRPLFMDKIKKALGSIMEECEKVCGELSGETLVCVGVFSNGGAVYERA